MRTSGMRPSCHFELFLGSPFHGHSPIVEREPMAKKSMGPIIQNQATKSRELTSPARTLCCQSPSCERKHLHSVKDLPRSYARCVCKRDFTPRSTSSLTKCRLWRIATHSGNALDVLGRYFFLGSPSFCQTPAHAAMTTQQSATQVCPGTNLTK